jgi:hypothetical protein
MIIVEVFTIFVIQDLLVVHQDLQVFQSIVVPRVPLDHKDQKETKDNQVKEDLPEDLVLMALPVS